MSDSFVIIRSSSLAWLVERIRLEGNHWDIPIEVARDLRLTIKDVDLMDPNPASSVLGPVLSLDQHHQLLAEDPDLNLPRGQAGEFWKMVLKIVYSMLSNEAEATLKIIGGTDVEN